MVSITVYYEYGNGATYSDEFDSIEEAEEFAKGLWRDDDMYYVEIIVEGE